MFKPQSINFKVKFFLMVKNAINSTTNDCETHPTIAKFINSGILSAKKE